MAQPRRHGALSVTLVILALSVCLYNAQNVDAVAINTGNSAERFMEAQETRVNAQRTTASNKTKSVDIKSAQKAAAKKMLKAKAAKKALEKSGKDKTAKMLKKANLKYEPTTRSYYLKTVPLQPPTTQHWNKKVHTKGVKCNRLVVDKKKNSQCVDYERACIKWQMPGYTKCLAWGPEISCWRYYGCGKNLRCTVWNRHCLTYYGQGLRRKCVVYGAVRDIPQKTLAVWSKQYKEDCSGESIKLRSQQFKKDRHLTQKGYPSARCIRAVDGECMDYDRECMKWEGKHQFKVCKKNKWGARLACLHWTGCGPTLRCIMWNYACHLSVGQGLKRRCVEFGFKRHVNAATLKILEVDYEKWKRGWRPNCTVGGTSIENEATETLPSLQTYTRAGCRRWITETVKGKKTSVCVDFSRVCLLYNKGLTKCLLFGPSLLCYKHTKCGKARRCVRWSHKCTKYHGKGEKRRCIKFTAEPEAISSTEKAALLAADKAQKAKCVSSRLKAIAAKKAKLADELEKQKAKALAKQRKLNALKFKVCKNGELPKGKPIFTFADGTKLRCIRWFTNKKTKKTYCVEFSHMCAEYADKARTKCIRVRSTDRVTCIEYSHCGSHTICTKYDHKCLRHDGRKAAKRCTKWSKNPRKGYTIITRAHRQKIAIHRLKVCCGLTGKKLKAAATKLTNRLIAVAHKKYPPNKNAKGQFGTCPLVRTAVKTHVKMSNGKEVKCYRYSKVNKTRCLEYDYTCTTWKDESKDTCLVWGEKLKCVWYQGCRDAMQCRFFEYPCAKGGWIGSGWERRCVHFSKTKRILSDSIKATILAARLKECCGRP